MASTLWAARPKSTLDCQLLLLGGEGAGKVKLFPHGRGHLQHGTGHEDPRASVGVRKLFTHLSRRVLLENPDSYTRISIRYRGVGKRNYTRSPNHREELFSETWLPT